VYEVHPAVHQAPESSAFRVIDMTTGSPVHANQMDRHRAMEMCAELERGLAVFEAQITSAFVRQHHAAEEQPATRSKAAERTAKWRAKQRAAAEAAAIIGAMCLSSAHRRGHARRPE
jgi:hypothetical protein